MTGPGDGSFFGREKRCYQGETVRTISPPRKILIRPPEGARLVGAGARARFAARVACDQYAYGDDM